MFFGIFNSFLICLTVEESSSIQWILLEGVEKNHTSNFLFVSEDTCIELLQMAMSLLALLAILWVIECSWHASNILVTLAWTLLLLIHLFYLIWSFFFYDLGLLEFDCKVIVTSCNTLRSRTWIHWISDDLFTCFHSMWYLLWDSVNVH